MKPDLPETSANSDPPLPRAGAAPLNRTVIVAGGGLVGLSAALGLAQAGFATIHVTPPAAQPGPRVLRQTVDHGEETDVDPPDQQHVVLSR